MKALELGEKLKVAIGNIYSIKGDDSFLKSYALAQLVDIIPISDREFCYDLFEGDVNIGDVVNACNTVSFFGGYRLVELKNYSKDLTTAEKKLLVDYAQSPNDQCIMVLNECGKALDCIKDFVVDIDCKTVQEYEIGSYINNLCSPHNIKLTKDLTKLIFQNASGDLGIITQEINKIVMYYASDNNEKPKTIEIGDIPNLISPNIEMQVFELTNALQNQDKQKALEVYRHLVSSASKSNIVFSVLLSNYRKLFQVAITNADDETIMRVMGIKAYPLSLYRKSIQQGKKQNRSYIPDLKKVVDYLFELEYKFKSGEILQESALELAFGLLIAQ